MRHSYEKKRDITVSVTTTSANGLILQTISYRKKIKVSAHIKSINLCKNSQNIF